MKIPEYFYFKVKSDEKGTSIILEDASDKDVVEVVRCRDCKHYDCEDGDQKCVRDAEWDEKRQHIMGSSNITGRIGSAQEEKRK